MYNSFGYYSVVKSAKGNTHTDRYRAIFLRSNAFGERTVCWYCVDSLTMVYTCLLKMYALKQPVTLIAATLGLILCGFISARVPCFSLAPQTVI